MPAKEKRGLRESTNNAWAWGVPGRGHKGWSTGNGEKGLKELLCEGNSPHFFKGEGDQGPEGRVGRGHSVRLFL